MVPARVQLQVWNGSSIVTNCWQKPPVPEGQHWWLTPESTMQRKANGDFRYLDWFTVCSGGLGCQPGRQAQPVYSQ